MGEDGVLELRGVSLERWAHRHQLSLSPAPGLQDSTVPPKRCPRCRAFVWADGDTGVHWCWYCDTVV